jgi:nucleotide-binding universal stress UspA family protein
MRPILCVIDLSETSIKVLEVAARMAYANKTHLTILFPYRLINNGYKDDVSKLKLKLEQEAREKFKEIEKKIVALKLIGFDFQPEIGFAADRISYYVKRIKVDMIILSQRQADSIGEINGLGLRTLITNSKVPFTIIPEEIDTEIFTH